MRLDKYLAETAQCTRSEAKTLLRDVYKRQVLNLRSWSSAT